MRHKNVISKEERCEQTSFCFAQKLLNRWRFLKSERGSIHFKANIIFILWHLLCTFKLYSVAIIIVKLIGLIKMSLLRPS